MHWIFPSIAGGLFGFGLGAFGDTVLTYVIDSNRLVSFVDLNLVLYETNDFRSPVKHSLALRLYETSLALLLDRFEHHGRRIWVFRICLSCKVR